MYVAQSIRDIFARNLRREMRRKGLRPSDLARLVWGEIKHGDRYLVRNPSAIGSYLAGKTLPQSANVQRLADALGVPSETLVPKGALPGKSPAVMPALQRERSLVQLSVSEPGMALLVFERQLPLKVALQIVALLDATVPETAQIVRLPRQRLPPVPGTAADDGADAA